MSKPHLTGSGLDEREIKAWIMRLGSFPKKRIKHKDFSAPYEIRRAHVLKLENCHFALVIERGCSSYYREDAMICLYQKEKDANQAFMAWVSKNTRLM